MNILLQNEAEELVALIESEFGLRVEECEIDDSALIDTLCSDACNNVGCLKLKLGRAKTALLEAKRKQ